MSYSPKDLRFSSLANSNKLLEVESKHRCYQDSLPQKDKFGRFLILGKRLGIQISSVRVHHALVVSEILGANEYWRLYDISFSFVGHPVCIKM